MNDDDLQRRIRDLDHGREPRPAFLDQLHDELAMELGLASRRVSVPRQPVTGVPVATDLRPARRHPVRLLLAAALLLSSSVAVALVAGRLLSPTPDLLGVIRGRGEIRAGVSSAYPQALSRAGGPAGFDVDLVTQVAAAVAVNPQLIVLPADQLVGDLGTLDLAVVPASALDIGPTQVVTSVPVVEWPVEVVVAADAPWSTLDELRDARLCVVAGSAGARWAVGQETGATVLAAAPRVAGIVPLETDTACLDLVNAGQVDALVTDALGPADLTTRPHLRALGAPVLRVPRVVAIAAAGPDPGALRATVDAAIERMRADGTLRDLSLRRFGVDLTPTSRP